MGPSAAPEGRVFHTLDALRGIGAVGVVLYHLKSLFLPVAAPGGYLAVDLFFMLSGVVLSHAYEARFRVGMGTLAFMRARLIRLYPLYLMGTLFGIVVTLASMRGHNVLDWDVSSLLQASVLALLFLPSFSVSPVNRLFPLNIPCWTMAAEILVNLLFVIFWPLLTSRRLIFISLLSGCAVVWAIVHQGNIDQGSTASSLVVGLVRTVFGFSVGVLIARHIRQTLRRENNLSVLAIVAVFVIAIIGWPRDGLRAVWDAVCLLLVFPTIVYFGTLIDPDSRLRRIATFFGVTSYAVYVLHTPLSYVVNSTIRISARGSGAPYSGVALFGVLLTGSWLIDRHFDMPVRRQLSRIVPKMRASPRTAPKNP
jgi:peptidoglycan/LPS O-acetylase OafA/YrhL